MKSILKQKETILLLLFLLINLIIENINGRFWLNDFKVYYSAAYALREGSNLYGEAFGLSSGYFKYSPFAALLFVPFTYLSYTAACFVYYGFICFATLFVFKKIPSLLREFLPNANPTHNLSLFFIAFIPSLTHLQRELHLGNINMILLAILVQAFYLIKTNRTMASAVLIALCICIKPHFIALLPLFVLRKYWPVFLTTMVSILIILFVPALFVGFEANIELLKEWGQAMQEHNFASEGFEQTVYYILSLYLGISVSLNHTLIEAGILAILIFLFVIKHLHSEKTNQQPENFFYEYFLIVACIPTLTLTDTEHFLFSLPIIMCLGLLCFSGKNKWQFYFLLLALICYGINIHDLVGKAGASWLYKNSILGIGNLMLIGLTMFLGFRNRTKAKN